MRYPLLHATGITATLLYAGFVVWVYATQPRTFKDVTEGARIASGANCPLSLTAPASPPGPDVSASAVDPTRLGVGAVAQRRRELALGDRPQ